MKWGDTAKKEMVLGTALAIETIFFQKFCEAVHLIREYREVFMTLNQQLRNHCCALLTSYLYSQKYLYLNDAKTFTQS